VGNRKESKDATKPTNVSGSRDKPGSYWRYVRDGYKLYEHPILSTFYKYALQNGRFYEIALLIILRGRNDHSSCDKITFRMPQRDSEIVHNERGIRTATKPSSMLQYSVNCSQSGQ
jgi:hypothetical protein